MKRRKNPESKMRSLERLTKAGHGEDFSRYRTELVRAGKAVCVTLEQAVLASNTFETVSNTTYDDDLLIQLGWGAIFFTNPGLRQQWENVKNYVTIKNEEEDDEASVGSFTEMSSEIVPFFKGFLGIEKWAVVLFHPVADFKLDSYAKETIESAFGRARDKSGWIRAGQFLWNSVRESVFDIRIGAWDPQMRCFIVLDENSPLAEVKDGGWGFHSFMRERWAHEMGIL